MNKQENNENWEAFFNSAPIETEPREEHQEQLKAQLNKLLNDDSDHTSDSRSRPQSKIKQIGSILMKYKIPHMATAAALLIAFSITFLSGGSQAFALDNVFAKIINAKFARWDMVVDLGDTKSTTRVSITPERTRHDEADGSYMVFDWALGKAVAFSPKDKTVKEVDTKTEGMGLQSFNMVKTLQDVLKAQLELGVEKVESLGVREFDGLTLDGFRVGPNHEIEIWVNPKTQSATRIEIATGVAGANIVVLENYESNVVFEEDFFSLALPDGYSRSAASLDVQPSEEDLIEALRISCEVSGGTFPKGLDIDSIAEVSADSLTYLVEKLDITGQPNSEQMGELLKGNIGFTFLYTFYASKKADAHYAGSNVKLNEKDRPIFWYKPTGSDAYRVIYADLEVEEMNSAPAVDGAVPLSTQR